jgi:hypothetical protein
MGSYGYSYWTGSTVSKWDEAVILARPCDTLRRTPAGFLLQPLAPRFGCLSEFRHEAAKFYTWKCLPEICRSDLRIAIPRL